MSEGAVSEAATATEAVVTPFTWCILRALRLFVPSVQVLGYGYRDRENSRYRYHVDEHVTGLDNFL
jgi:hypothetical protein